MRVAPHALLFARVLPLPAPFDYAKPPLRVLCSKKSVSILSRAGISSKSQPTHVQRSRRMRVAPHLSFSREPCHSLHPSTTQSLRSGCYTSKIENFEITSIIHLFAVLCNPATPPSQPRRSTSGHLHQIVQGVDIRHRTQSKSLTAGRRIGSQKDICFTPPHRII